MQFDFEKAAFAQSEVMRPRLDRCLKWIGPAVACLITVGTASHESRIKRNIRSFVGLKHPVDCTTIDNQVLADDGIRVIAAEQRAKCPEIVRIRQSLRRHAEEFDESLLLEG